MGQRAVSTLAPVLIKPFLNPPYPQGLNVGCGLAEGTRLNLLQCVPKSPLPPQRHLCHKWKITSFCLNLSRSRNHQNRGQR